MLTVNQEAFVTEYLRNGRNGRQAYLVAYPNSRKWLMETVDSRASELLRHRKVAERLAEANQAAKEKAIITCEEILEQCRNIALADVRQLFSKAGTTVPPNELPEAIAKAIIQVDVIPTDNGNVYRYKLSNKDKTLDLLAKIMGMLDKKQEEKPPEVNVRAVYGGEDVNG